MNKKLLRGDCLELLKTLPDNSVDSIVTDPPYGLSKEPNMQEVLASWLAGEDYRHRGGGFMGKTWDSFVPGPAIWRECLRVLKPGGHLLSFFSSRTYDLGALAIRLAGFEVRDQIMWVYGSGFPKSLNLGDGRGTALKPAHEPIVMARKPFKGTVAANVQEHGTGALNIDACRVKDGTETGGDKPEYHANNKNAVYGAGMGGGDWENVSGRWPANFVHDGLNGEAWARYFYCGKTSRADRDEGVTFEPASVAEMVNRKEGSAGANHPRAGAGGRVGARNHHPTVKPTALMSWLCRLVTPPGGVVLDPFMGSGSTGKAAMLEGFRFIGIEMDEGYFAVAEQRIAAAANDSDYKVRGNG